MSSSEIDPLQLLTVRQVAELLAVSERTVFGLIARGDLRSVKIRRSLRVPRKGLEEFLDRSVQ